MTTSVAPRKIKIAKDFGLANVDIIAPVSRSVGLQFYAACALMQKESMGRNVYGHDSGGALSGFPGEVNQGNWEVFRWLVFDQNKASNGVGPCQLTYRGFFTDMEKQKLKPYIVWDNLLYGLRLLKGYHDLTQSWKAAGTKYNGSALYGASFEKIVGEWKVRILK